jgi:hypothetical protein
MKTLNKILKGVGIASAVSAGFFVYSCAIIAIENKTLNPAKIIRYSKKFNQEKYEKDFYEEVKDSYCFASYD